MLKGANKNLHYDDVLPTVWQFATTCTKSPSAAETGDMDTLDYLRRGRPLYQLTVNILFCMCKLWSVFSLKCWKKELMRSTESRITKLSTESYKVMCLDKYCSFYACFLCVIILTTFIATQMIHNCTYQWSQMKPVSWLHLRQLFTIKLGQKWSDCSGDWNLSIIFDWEFQC